MPSSAPEKVDRACFNALEVEGSKRLIKEHINDLAERTLESRKAFEEIGKLLAWFDGKKFKAKDGSALPALSPGWESLRSKYNELLKRSHHDAATIQGICHKYIVVVLGVLEKENSSKEDAKKALKKFFEDTAMSESHAQCTAADLDELRYDLDMRKEEILDTVWTAEAGSRVLQLRESIRQLSDQIAKFRKSFMEGWKKSFIDTGKGLAGIVMGLCPKLANRIDAETHGPGRSDSSQHPELWSAEENESKLQQELASELSKVDDAPEKPRIPEGKLGEIVTHLQPSGSAFHKLITHIGALENFWEAVRADCQIAVEHLERVDPKSFNSLESKTLLGRQLAGSAYEILNEALGTYTSQLSTLRL